MGLVLSAGRTSQPQQTAVLNLSSDLLQGAQVLALINGATGQNLGPGKAVKNGNIAPFGVPNGKGLANPTGGGDFGAVVPAAGGSLLVDFWVGNTYSGAPSTSQYIFGDYTGTAGSGLARAHSGIAGRWGYFNGTSVLDSGETLANGYDVFVVVREVLSGRTVVYRNGVLKIATGSIAASTDAWAFGSVGQNQFATFGAETNTLLAGRLQFKAWDADQVQRFTRNPWQLFAPEKRRIWVAPAATASGTAALTGQTATSTQGAPVARLSLATSGNSSTASAGSVTASLSRAITGSSATASQGVPTAALSLALTGNTATTTAGTVAATQPGTVGLTGNSATATRGALVARLSLAITGNSATASAGTVTASSGATQALAGNSATATRGTPTAALSLALTGNTATATAGAPTSSVPGGVALTGNSTTASQGAPVAGLSLALKGNSPMVRYANDKAVLHFDGPGASTIFTDAVGSAWTVNGNAQIDTAQSKFGGASGLFDGTGDWIETPDHSNFALGTNNFTIEFWLRPNTIVGGLQGLASQCPTNAAVNASNSFQLAQNGSSLDFHCGEGILRKGSLIVPSILTASIWHHIAYVRNGNRFDLYVNGISAANVTETATINDSPSVLTVGSVGQASGFFLNGWIDDFRLNNGTAIYTANFIPLETGSNTATATVGTVTASIGNATALSGQMATATSGTPVAELSLGLTGNSATATRGALVAALSLGLTGNTATATAGAVSASTSGGAITLALTGNMATATAGLLSTGAGAGGYDDDKKKKRKAVVLKEMSQLNELILRRDEDGEPDAVTVAPTPTPKAPKAPAKFSAELISAKAKQQIIDEENDEEEVLMLLLY